MEGEKSLWDGHFCVTHTRYKQWQSLAHPEGVDWNETASSNSFQLLPSRGVRGSRWPAEVKLSEMSRQALVMEVSGPLEIWPGWYCACFRESVSHCACWLSWFDMWVVHCVYSTPCVCNVAEPPPPFTVRLRTMLDGQNIFQSLAHRASRPCFDKPRDRWVERV